MAPKFSVGQRVMMIGDSGRIYDNNHVVLDIKYYEATISLDGSRYSGWGYKISNDPEVVKDFDYFHEVYLRPIPDENDKEAFEQFKKKLKLPNDVVTV